MRKLIQNRREFLKTSLAGLALGSSMMKCQMTGSSGIPTRPLGSTGERVPIVGIGGWDIGNIDADLAIRIMHEAIESGMTFFDNCWDYHQGGSETVMGKALSSSSKRDQVFLMSKVCARDYEGAKQHLEDSLRRLQTDHLDLWQFHGLRWKDDPELIFDPENGALKAALEAKQTGKVRFIGFTGHQDPDYHQAMLDKDFSWDTVQLPLNLLDAHYRSFQKLILPLLVERNIGVVGMKALASQEGIMVRHFGISAEFARRYTLSLPISTLACGIQSVENLRQDLEIARNFKPMEEDEIRSLLDQVKDEALDGELEQYKVGNWGCNWHHEQQSS